MFVNKAERPELLGWALRRLATISGGALMVNHFLFCFVNLGCVSQTLNQAVSGSRRPSIIWRV